MSLVNLLPSPSSGQKPESGYIFHRSDIHRRLAELVPALETNTGQALLEGGLLLGCMDYENRLPDAADYAVITEMVAEVTNRIDLAQGDNEQESAWHISMVMSEIYGFRGNAAAYYEPAAANILNVLQRRTGLPVALGLIYIVLARAAGWEASGLAFPGHFLLRLEIEGQRAIIDAFHSGQICHAKDLRHFAKLLFSEEKELESAWFQTISDRDILLRIQNNLKILFLRRAQYDDAAVVLESMITLAPGEMGLVTELGQLYLRIGHLQRARHVLNFLIGNSYASEVERAHAESLLSNMQQHGFS